MKNSLRKIYVVWRKGKGSRRKIVGILKRTATNGISFTYIKKGVEEARREGFKEYPGFPLTEDYSKSYQEDDLDIFSLRLIPFDRKDNSKILDFWEAKGITDKFSLLALTQGLLPTDNFEFLGLFSPKRGFRFVTDIAGLTHLELSKDVVSEGDILNYEIESNSFAFQKKAVKVFKGNTYIGYIKNVHNNIFIQSENKGKLKLKVKAIEQNGLIQNIFVLVNSSY